MMSNIVAGETYSPDDVAFYARAIVNYEDDRKETPGEWPKHPQNGVPLNYVGRVTVRVPQYLPKFQLPYGATELMEVVKQGRDRPRVLEQQESRAANAARRDYREQSQWFEAWAVRECGARRYSPLTSVSTEYVPTPQKEGA